MISQDRLQAVLGRLDQVRKSGDGWIACCPVPAHDDRVPSLSIAIGDSGTLLLHCHGGCQYEDIVASLGLGRPAQSQTKPRNGKSESQKHGHGCRVVSSRNIPGKHYEYCDIDGHVVMIVARQDNPKSFRPYYQHGGGWTMGDPPGALRLYNLSALADAKLVYVCEGEKDADALNGIGLTATTSAHGAKSAKRTDWSPLAGKYIIILPHNDKAGAGYAKDAVGLLKPLGSEIRIVDLPGLTHGQDVFDWLAGLGEGIEAIEALAELAAQVRPINRPGLVVEGMADVEEVDVEWLWKGRIPLGELTILGGNGGLGKSWLAADIAARVSTGTAWPDDRDTPNPAGDVLFLDNENRPSILKKRLRASGANMNRIGRVKHVELPKDGDTKPFCIDTDLAALGAALDKKPHTRLVVIDVLNAYFGGNTDTHRDSDVRQALMPLSDLARDQNVAILCLHHFNKGTGKAGNMLTGSLAFRNCVRSTIYLLPDLEDENRQNPRRLLLVDKANLQKKPDGLAFNFGPNPMTGEVELQWDADPVKMTTDEALGDPNKSRLQRDEAGDWILERLAGGPVKSNDLKDEVKNLHPFGWSTFLRAARSVGALSRSVPASSGRVGYWEFYLPPRERES